MPRAAAIVSFATVAVLAAVGLHTGLAGATDVGPTPPRAAELPVGEQFQQAFSIARNDYGCSRITLPSTKTLTLQTVLVNAASLAEPKVWLDVAIASASNTSHMISPVRLQSAGGNHWTGELSTTLYSGPVDPQGRSFDYLLCVLPASGNWAEVTAVVAGRLNPRL